MLLYWKSADVQSTIYSNRLVSSLSVVAINNALVSAQWPPSRNLIAIGRDSVANSRGVSVVVTQEPAQPLATLYSFVTTSFRDLRKQQTLDFP
jgi:hypothetical protein